MTSPYLMNDAAASTVSRKLRKLSDEALEEFKGLPVEHRRLIADELGTTLTILHIAHEYEIGRRKAWKGWTY